MKTKTLVLAVSGALLVSLSARAGDPPPETSARATAVPAERFFSPPSEAPAPLAPALPAAPPTAQPSTSITRFADRCTNFTTNGWAFKSPRNFLQWLDVFSDPGIYLEFGRRGLDPDQWVSSLDSLMDPGTPRNHLEWTNPEIYAGWARALEEPGFVTAVNATLFDPGRMMRWVMLPMDGQAWRLLGATINPATWVKWLNAPLDSKTQALFAKAADPETSRRWLEALGDPKNTPWLNPPLPQAASSAHPAAPAAAASRREPDKNRSRL